MPFLCYVYFVASILAAQHQHYLFIPLSHYYHMTYYTPASAMCLGIVHQLVHTVHEFGSLLTFFLSQMRTSNELLVLSPHPSHHFLSSLFPFSQGLLGHSSSSVEIKDMCNIITSKEKEFTLMSFFLS